MPESTVCLPSDLGISRQHAMIRSHNGFDYQIIDLGSRNGTYINDQRVVLPGRLENGARILIAENVIVFEQIEEAATEQQTSTLPGRSPGSIHDSVVAALLVCDIRGFTVATETLSKDDLAQTIGCWFREASNLIHKRGGNIDKFIGDAFFAYWTNFGSQASACEAAMETGKELLRLARTLKWPHDDEPLEVAIALHCGNVTCRSVGGFADRDVSMMGDAVNTVFRLESTAKELNQRLLASQDFVSSLASSDAFTDLGERMLKGKRHPVRVFGFDDTHEYEG